jgi:GntR family transcriptional regulator/MocR family aminotransferase
MAPTSQGWADLYAWQLDRASRTPLSRQIYAQVRSAVLSGTLRAGTRVPSSRAMASQLSVARASVVSAYEQLLAEGYVESRHGSGTFISVEGDAAPQCAARDQARGGADIGAGFSGRRCRARLARSIPAAR